jgi:hypothetical protein
MLAAASAIPTPGKTILNATQAEQLFTQAQDAVLRRTRSTPSKDQFDEIAPAKSSLQTVQCLILFSLRQTSGGNKSSAYLWYCHAAAMALELGLHRVTLDKSKQSQVCLCYREGTYAVWALTLSVDTGRDRVPLSSILDVLRPR